MGDDYSHDLAHRLLDAARGLGTERAVDLVLNVLFVRWMTLQARDQAVGDATWESVLAAESDHELASVYARLAVFRDSDLGIDASMRLDVSALRRVVHLVDAEMVRTGTAHRVLADTFEGVLAGLAKLGKQAGEAETPSEVAKLMTALTVRPGDRVLDPACGNGTALLTAARRQHAGGVSGFEINIRTRRRAAMRLLINGIDTGSGFGVSPGDAFLEYEPGGAEVVLAQPPWGPTLLPSQQAVASSLATRWAVPAGRRLSGDAAWLLLTLDAMAEGAGRAAIVLPASSSGPRDRGLWHHLLRHGFIEAVVALPAGLFANTGVASVLWILRSPTAHLPAQDILMLDASSLARSAGSGSRMVLMEDASEHIAGVLDRWRAGEPLEAGSHLAHAVPLAELERSQDLHPSRFLDPAPEEPIIHPSPVRRLLIEVGLTRFKAFDERTVLPLAPLTFLYGPNSAGKSSVIQALLLLKQSRESSALVTQGPLANVGSFQGLVHGHADTDLAIAISYGALAQWLSPTGTPDPSLTRSVQWSFVSDPSGQARSQKVTTSFGEYTLALTRPEESTDTFVIDVDELGTVFRGLASGRLLYPFDQRPDVSDDETVRRRTRQEQRNATRALAGFHQADVHALALRARGLVPSSERLTELPTAAQRTRENGFANSFAKRTAALVGGVSEEVDQLLENLAWLGPLRSAPQRVYDRATATRGSGDGADVALYLFDHASVVEQVNDWLARLEVPYTVEVVPIAAGEAAHLVGDLVAIALTDTRTGVVVTPADVGYGVSQVLPIVVELLARRECVVAIEQPETHLHPRLQARLADLFIDSAQAGGRGNQLIVETHSEHMMLRVQRRIREGVINASDVSVLYVDRAPTGPATVRQLRLNDDGEFRDEWPGGFFDDRLDELFAGI